MCSAIADIATCIPTQPTGYGFSVLLHTQVQSLSRWSAVVHTRPTNDLVDLPLSIVLEVQGLQVDEDLGERFEFWTPTN